MSTITAERPPGPRPSRARPARLFAGAVLIAAATWLVSLVGTPPTGAPVDRDAAPSGFGVDAPGGPITGSAHGSLETIDRSIAVWGSNLRANDRDFLSATNLGILFQARGRLSGDVADLARAEEALARALAIEPTHASARAAHASVLVGLHEFATALVEGEALLGYEPAAAPALATIGDAALELGRYERAREAYDELARRAPGPAVTARLAHLAYIDGRPAEAASLAERSVDEARAAGEEGPALGWYLYLAGTMARQTGDPAAARRWLDEAAVAWPRSHLVLAGQARVAIAEGRRAEAIDLLERSTAIAPLPESVGLLGDLYRLAGRTADAAERYETVRAIGAVTTASGSVFDRALTLFDLEHDGDPEDALRRAEAELAARSDVFGHDVHAWALHAVGRLAEAEAAMEKATALGTRDAILAYHGGMIAAASGDAARARELLEEALRIGLASDPVPAGRARATLAGLGSTP
jgi:tetratricopeptide (TPR) repeat protein